MLRTACVLRCLRSFQSLSSQSNYKLQHFNLANYFRNGANSNDEQYNFSAPFFFCAFNVWIFSRCYRMDWRHERTRRLKLPKCNVETSKQLIINRCECFYLSLFNPWNLVFRIFSPGFLVSILSWHGHWPLYSIQIEQTVSYFAASVFRNTFILSQELPWNMHSNRNA